METAQAPLSCPEQKKMRCIFAKCFVFPRLFSSPWMAFRVITMLGQILVPPLCCSLKGPRTTDFSSQSLSVLICTMGSPLSLQGDSEDGRLSQQAEQDLTLRGHSSSWEAPPFHSCLFQSIIWVCLTFSRPGLRIPSPASSAVPRANPHMWHFKKSLPLRTS